MRVRWRRWLGFGLLSLVALAGVAILLIETGIVEGWVRHMAVSEIERRTGGRVDLGGFRLNLWHLRAEFDDLTLHGLEPPGTPPLFHVAHLNLTVHVLSFVGKQFALDELILDQPQLALRVDKEGKSNLPTPNVPKSNRPWRATLFSLHIGHLEFRDGSVTFNNHSAPLAMLGKDLQFHMQGVDSPDGTRSYAGNLQWRQIELAAPHDLPFRFDISAKFTLHPNAFELDDLALKLPHSDLNLRAELASFSQPSDWTLHYRGKLTLADVRTILCSPLTPEGVADFSGEARSADGKWAASGHYKGHDFVLSYKWFHARGMETWGDYEVANNLLTVRDLNIRALGGSITGRLEMETKTLSFRTATQVRGVSLSTAFAAVQNPSFPVVPLHWDARMDVDSVNTWTANFQHFHSKGECRWSPPDALEGGLTAVTARIEYDTSADSKGVSFGASEISTPKTDIQMDGFLGARGSALNVSVRTDDVLGWDDFINVIRGAESAPSRIAGALAYRGRIDGPLGGPTFTGHVQATDARFDNFYFSYLGGDLEYSPDIFKLTKTIVRRGDASADVDVFLDLDNWGFAPASQWTFDARLAHAPAGDLQQVFGLNLPVKGILSGSFHGSGTRMAPIFDANFALDNAELKGNHIDRLAGLLHLAHDQYLLTNGELRSGPGLVTGNVLYKPIEQETEFDLTGRSIPLEKVAALQSPSVPISGRLDFDVHGHGPILSPIAQGNVRLVNLQVGPDVQGNFRGRVFSDGETAKISLVSEINAGRLQGEFSIGLHGDNQVTGQLSVKQFQMDAFIMSGLHLKQLTGHSSVDGHFTLSGSLRRPETIEIGADIEEISFNYDLVALKNEGPIRLTYRRNEVRIEQARLHGPNTDLAFSGSARFDRDRPLHLALAGTLNLRFLDRMVPDLFALGSAEVNVSVEGNMSRPRITGRASLKDASATYSDFPVGLSHVNGDLVFDSNRMIFDRITAQAGGGQLLLNGAVNYGEGPLRYELNVSTTQVRIRYPAGMSWLASGALQLSGSSTAAILSGRVQIHRLLLAEGVDMATLFVAAAETSASPASSSTLMRNLTFDIEGTTAPGARIEWSGAHLEVDGDVRLRGTWDRPVLLGHVHLLGGEMAFRGNNYTLTRGDVNFANPFRLDPVLNVEATSTIGQYQVTINFSGQASHLALTYRSDPPLPDSDIIALLALGSTGQESALRSSSSSQNYGATALLSEAISSGLGGRIERLFGISHFRVDPFLAGTATESNAAARVTIQQQFTRNLTVTYSTNAATTNQYQLIQVEYAVKRDLSVIFVRDINGTYAFEVRFVRHFK